jgi:hypothetical protein
VRLWREDSQWQTKEDHRDKVIQVKVVQEAQDQEDHLYKEILVGKWEDQAGRLAKVHQIEDSIHQDKVDNPFTDHMEDLVDMVDLVG